MIRAFFSALAFLTVIPIPSSLKSSRENAMLGGYPAAGLVIGCLLSLLYFLAGLVFSDQLAAIVLVAGSLGLTGAIHLDGLADCADAFYGRRDRESTMRILKDPRIGTMGGAAIGLSLLTRYAAVVSLSSPVVLLALPILSAFSRTLVLAALRFLPYARSSGGILSPAAGSGDSGEAAAGQAASAGTAQAASTTSSGQPASGHAGSGQPASGQAPEQPAPRHRTGLLVLAAAVVLIVLILLPLPAAFALAALAGFWRLSWKRIGGCTGDVLGASIEIAEIVFLAALAALDHSRVSVGAFFPLAALIFPNAALGS